jgi:hypothetical protein
LSLFKIPDPRALLSHPFILAIIARLFLRRALLSHPFILAIIARLSLRRAILSPPLILLPRFRIDFPLFLSGPLGAFGTLAALAKFRPRTACRNPGRTRDRSRSCSRSRPRAARTHYGIKHEHVMLL